MKLVYNWNNEPVKLGDRTQLSNGDWVKVHYFRKPHKPAAQGKVSVLENGTIYEYYVSIIGATWIEREDQ